MPVYEEPKSGGKWWKTLLAGCAGITILIICAYVVLSIYISRSVSRLLSSTPPPSKSSTSRYAVPSGTNTATCSFMLPSRSSKLTYYHDQPGAWFSGGVRGIRISYNAGMSQDWPLPNQLKNVKVDVYWYEAKNGLGPFIRFYDAGGSYVLDLRTKEVGDLQKHNGSLMFVKYAYSDDYFLSGIRYSTDSSGKEIITDHYGNPARNVSAAINPANCTYLGSIVMKGNNLFFINSKKSKP